MVKILLTIIFTSIFILLLMFIVNISSFNGISGGSKKVTKIDNDKK